LFFGFLSEGRTFVRIVLLVNVFSIVNWWRRRSIEDDFLGDLTDESLVMIVGIWYARNGRVIWLFDFEETKWISSRTFSLEIRRDTAQRWIFRLRLLLVGIDETRLGIILIFGWSFEFNLAVSHWLPKPSSESMVVVGFVWTEDW
jgi:hypothetical protein